MLYATTPIQWLDLDKGESYTKSVMELYSMYSDKSTRLSDLLSVIDFPEPQRVKITDWFGWTDILQVRRHQPLHHGKWMIVRVPGGDRQLQLSKETIIPIYDPESGFQGFHGETKYLFELKRLDDLPRGYYEHENFVRVRREVDASGEPIEFTKLNIAAVYSGQGDGTGYDIGYEIITRSGFFNAHDVHLWGRLEIPEKLCDVCPNRETHQCSKCFAERLNINGTGSRPVAHNGELVIDKGIAIDKTVQVSFDFDKFQLGKGDTFSKRGGLK